MFQPGYIPVNTMHVPLTTQFIPSPENLAIQNQIYSAPKHKYQNGYMYVQLDRAFYFPGDTVYGKVFINNLLPTRCERVKLEVEGKEKAEWTRYWTEYETHTRRVERDGEWIDEDYQVAVERHEHLKKKHVAMDFEVPLMDMAPLDYTIQVANYEASFSFKLPNKVGASLHYEDDSVREKPEAKVEHKMKISLLGTGLKDKPKAKAEIVVRMRPVQNVELE